jgi:hypothetical protein
MPLRVSEKKRKTCNAIYLVSPEEEEGEAQASQSMAAGPMSWLAFCRTASGDRRTCVAQDGEDRTATGKGAVLGSCDCPVIGLWSGPARSPLPCCVKSSST